MPHHDLVIIGTGSGNSLLTPELDGLDVAIVEGGTFGGTCLNVGCIPTKMFVLPADRVVEAADSHRLGVTFSGPTVDWPGIRDRVFGRIDPISAGGEAYREGQDHVTVYRRPRQVHRRATAVALDRRGADRRPRRRRRRAARPKGLDVEGLRAPDPDRGLHTSDTVMRLDALPPRMAVVGGGYVACELAHVFSSLGVAVTQVQRGPVLLSHHEVEVAQRYTEVARRHIDLRLSTTPTSAERIGDVWRIEVDGPGRPGPRRGGGRPPRRRAPPQHRPARPRGRAGSTSTTTAGSSSTPSSARPPTGSGPSATSAPSTSSSTWPTTRPGSSRTTSRSTSAASPGTRARTDDRPVPHAVFGHPQVAAFGPTAAELEDAGTPLVTATQAFGDVAYGWALEDTTGILTVHADPSGRVLAAHAVGPHSSTLIQPLIQAATFGQHAHDVARGQYWIHPALAEVVENALLGLPLADPS